MTRCHITGKDCHATAAKAYRIGQQLLRRHRDRAEDKFVHGDLRAYRCTCCHQWHLGHVANMGKRA